MLGASYSRCFLRIQERDGREAIELVIETLCDTIGGETALGLDTLTAFVGELRQLLIQIQGLWRAIQQGKQKLEPNFAYSTSGSQSWHIFSIYGKISEGHQTARMTNNVADDVVIFPRIYLMETDAEPISITHGAVLRKDELDAAAEEARKGFSVAPFAQPTSGRHRARVGRTLSIAGDSARGGRKDGFLG